jgi:hypothetical protein
MRRGRAKYVAVTVEAGPEDVEAFGPFTSQRLADKAVAEHDERAVRSAYPLMVVELRSVRELLAEIREEKQINEREDY